jgi:hypothetical protein
MDLERQILELKEELDKMKKEQHVDASAVKIRWIPLPDAMIALGKCSLRVRKSERGKNKGKVTYERGEKVPMSYQTIMKMLKSDPEFELKKVKGNWFIVKYPNDFAA